MHHQTDLHLLTFPQREEFESQWHLLIPPIMTFLDDYQAPYKLKGIALVSRLLDRVPVGVLKRTGLVQLLFTVCKILSEHFSLCLFLISSP